MTTPLATPTHLNADNRQQAHLFGLVHNLLELPSCDVAEAYVVDLSRINKISESSQSFLNRCSIIPTVCLMELRSQEKKVQI